MFEIHVCTGIGILNSYYKTLWCLCLALAYLPCKFFFFNNGYVWIENLVIQKFQTSSFIFTSHCLVIWSFIILIFLFKNIIFLTHCWVLGATIEFSILYFAPLFHLMLGFVFNSKLLLAFLLSGLVYKR